MNTIKLLNNMFYHLINEHDEYIAESISLIISLFTITLIEIYTRVLINKKYDYKNKFNNFKRTYLDLYNRDNRNVATDILFTQPYNKYIALYNIESNYKYKHVYLPILLLIIIIMDPLSMIVKTYYYKMFMAIGIIIFSVAVIGFSCGLGYYSLKKLRNININNKILKNYSPYIAIIVTYLSLIIIAFRIIPNKKTDIIGNLLVILIQILFILSLIKVKNSIVFHCEQKIAIYKVKRVYNDLLYKFNSQKKAINSLKRYKRHTREAKYSLKYLALTKFKLLKQIKQLRKIVNDI